jgi:hypothetical protein
MSLNENEIAVVRRAKRLIEKIEDQGGLCQGGEQSPNGIECDDVAGQLGSILPEEPVSHQKTLDDVMASVTRDATVYPWHIAAIAEELKRMGKVLTEMRDSALRST